MSMS